MTAYHVPARALALATLACATPALAGCTSPDAQKSPGAEANAGPKMNPQNSGANWSFRQTGEVTRFEVHAGDRWHGDGTQLKERSEAYASGKLSLTQPNDVRFDMMIEQGPRITAQWLTLVQLQSTFDPGEVGHSPPFAIELRDEKMRIASRFDPRLISRGNDAPYTLHYADTAPLQRGRWYAMRIAVKFDPAGAGWLKVWRDGRQIVDYRGPIGFNDVVGPYFKAGIYRASAREPMAVQFRGVRIGTLPQ